MCRCRYLCNDKERFIKGVEDKMFYDRPVGYTPLYDLFGRGIHFRENGEQIKGIFYYERETSSARGNSLIRVKFKGSFVEDGGQLFFDLRIYPPILDVIFFLGILIMCAVTGRIDTFVIATIFISIFGWGYYKSIKETAKIFDRMIV